MKKIITIGLMTGASIFLLSCEQEAQQANVVEHKVDGCPTPKIENLLCTMEKHQKRAGILCSGALAKIAKGDIEWTNEWGQPKLNGAMWNLEGDTEFKIIGLEYWTDKVKIQNDFGAYKRVILKCDYDFENQEVLDVRIES
ncbi:MAG: hypothetical protein GY804_00105 [Alphaproteobacteria bacterium]|nr:hypothetical protein [Alphaproteobacteria bacterium]